MRRWSRLSALMMTAVLCVQSFAVPVPASGAAYDDQIVVSDSAGDDERSSISDDLEASGAADDGSVLFEDVSEGETEPLGLSDPAEAGESESREGFLSEETETEPGSGDVVIPAEEPGAGNAEAPEAESGSEDTAVPVMDMEEATEEDFTNSSLLPVEEKHAALILADMSETYLKNNVTAGYVLDNAICSDGTYIGAGIPEDSKIAWSCYRDQYGNAIKGEYHVVSRSDTVDMSAPSGSAMYEMEFIVGDGTQLGTGNTRYIITVFLTSRIAVMDTVELYTQTASGSRLKLQPSRVRKTPEGIEFYVPQHVSGQKYYMAMRSLIGRHPHFRELVYTPDQYQARLSDEKNGWKNAESIGDSILNVNMKEKNAGYCASFDPADDRTFVLVVEHPETHKILYTRSLKVSVTKDKTCIDARVFKKTGDTEVLAASVSEQAEDLNTYPISEDYEGVENQTLTFDAAYEGDGDYYLRLSPYHEVYGSDAAAHISSVYEGIFDTESDAAASGKGSLKDMLFDEGGIRLSYKELFTPREFTVFFDDGTCCRIRVSVSSSLGGKAYDAWEEYYSEPVVGARDPWFRVTGAMLDGRVLDTYVAENNSARKLDTSYGQGYQTLFVNEKLTADEMRRIVPVFWVADPARIRVRTNTSQDEVSGVTAHDFTSPVEYHALFEGRQKNYSVEIAAKSSGPRLFVFGKDGTKAERSREVLLTRYFGYKHDILVANLGDEELEGLKVRLQNASHVKLDDYWTFGNGGTDSLSPFTATSGSAAGGELWNLAKIRLVPDGEGEVSGKLVISAEGQEDVVITLYGSAIQPVITTSEVPDGIKYVPYSYVIATNNRDDSVDVTFRLHGNLAPGLSFNARTGEIYGAPTAAGRYSFRIDALYDSDSLSMSTRSFTMNVSDNSNEAVFLSSDKGYEIVPEEYGQSGYVGARTAGSKYDFVVDSTDSDELYISAGDLGEFETLWLNGQKLVRGQDYSAEKGSTRLTIFSQTLKNKTRVGERNTISAEYRIRTGNSSPKTGRAGNKVDPLRKTSQNFVVRRKSTSSPSRPVTPVSPGKGTSTSPQSGLPHRGATAPAQQPSHQNTGAAASGTGSSGTKAAAVQTTIRLNRSVAYLKKGKSVKLKATTNRKVQVTWKSSNKKVATVKSGKVKAKKKGKAVITAITSDGKRASCTVYVGKPSVKKLTLNKKSVKLKAAKTVKLKVKVSPSRASKKGITWKSSNSNVATVKNGRVTAIGKGTCRITATAPNGKKASCKVKVTTSIRVKSVSISTADLTLQQGQGVRITAAVKPAKASIRTVTWKTSDAKIATVSGGMIMAVSPGTAVIKASAGGKSASCAVTVTAGKTAQTGDQGQTSQPGTQGSQGQTSQPGTSQPGDQPQTPQTETPQTEAPALPEKIVLAKDTLSLAEGETCRLEAAVTPANASDQQLSWYSDNPDVADVDQNGEVRANGIGTATVTAETVNHLTASCSVTVTGSEEEVTQDVLLDSDKLKLEEGESAELKLSAGGDPVSADSVAWSSTNDRVASVARGMVTANAEGYATILARADGDLVATCSVEVTEKQIEAAAVTLSETSVRLNLNYHDGQTKKISSSVLPANATDRTPVWTCADESIATVQDGTIAAVGTGTTTVTATMKSGVSASCEVTVVDAPREISNADELKAVGDDLYADYILTQDIDLSSLEGEDWKPLGDQSHPFCGTFDGSGHTISNMKITEADLTYTDMAYAGLFAVCEGTVKNLSVSGSITLAVNRSGVFLVCAGGICGYLQGGQIRNCSTDVATKVVNAYPGKCRAFAGGIAGQADGWDAVIEGCSVKGSTRAGAGGGTWGLSRAGGITSGLINKAHIDSCSNYGYVKAYSTSVSASPFLSAAAGGIAGSCGDTSGDITNCLNYGNVDAVADSSRSSDQSVYKTSACYAGGIEGNGRYRESKYGNTNNGAEVKATGSDLVLAYTEGVPEYPIPSSISLSSTDLSMYVEDTRTLTASVEPSGTPFQSVDWTSSDKSVAVVENGTVTAVGFGTAKITAEAVRGDASASCTVTVSRREDDDTGITSVSIDYPKPVWQNPIVGVGQTQQFTATVTSENQGVYPVTWSSSDPSVLSVDRNGLVTGISAGTADITARASNGIMETLPVEVPAGYVEPLDDDSLTNGYWYSVTWGDTLKAHVRLYLNDDIGAKQGKYILYVGVDHNELAAFDIDGETPMKERYTGKASIGSLSVRGKVADVEILIDTSRIEKPYDKQLEVCVFPSDNFATGGVLYEMIRGIMEA